MRGAGAGRFRPVGGWERAVEREMWERQFQSLGQAIAHAIGDMDASSCPRPSRRPWPHFVDNLAPGVPGRKASLKTVTLPYVCRSRVTVALVGRASGGRPWSWLVCRQGQRGPARRAIRGALVLSRGR